MFIRRDFDTHVLLEFHAPETANALTIEAARALAAFRVDRPVVVRSGHPRVFCAGGNLIKHLEFTNAAAGLADNAELARHLDAFGAWPVPKLAVIEGEVLGGGVEWLARFDHRWATPAARLAFWQKRVGLLPGWGGGRAWADKLGEARVRQLLLEARPLGAHEAFRRGLVDRVVTPAAVDGEITRWARELTSPLDAAVLNWRADDEGEHFARVWWGEAHRAALKRWAARRR